MQLETGQQSDPRIRRALARGHLIDLTTYGRRTGLPRRIELVFHAIDGRVIVSGMPRRRPRAWLLNVRANPHVILHLKSIVDADLPATAREITDSNERRALMARVAANWGRADLDEMLAHSPLIELVIDGYAPAQPEG